MANTTEVAEHINYIENKLTNNIGKIINELELPKDFCLDTISIDIIPVQEIGTNTTSYVLADKVKLNVSWNPTTITKY